MTYEFKSKFSKAKNSVKKHLKTGLVWASDNKEILIFLVPVVVGGIAGTAKFANKHYTIKKQETLKNLYCYDRSLGHYWKLKRELSNAEWINIGKRKNAGEPLVMILDELKVLN